MENEPFSRTLEQIRSSMKIRAPLDPGFAPMSLWARHYEQQWKDSGREAVFRVTREGDLCDHVSIPLPPAEAEDLRAAEFADRTVKALLWMRGGWRIDVAGSAALYRFFADAYREGGSRAFDAGFMALTYRRPFEVHWAQDADALRVRRDRAENIGCHLEGCRIGFDAGGSDRKVSAVIDGEAVYSEEVVWSPKTQSDPDYHYSGILEAFRTAAAHLPRVDAIGVSSAGIFINDEPTVNSGLFRKIPPELYRDRVAPIYKNAARAMGEGIPLTVANDGDVTALAGAMSLGEGSVLGIAMGTSEAGGYVDDRLRLMGWLTELAFVPVDADPDSMKDEWSGDYGTGVTYFSQDAVIKLCPAAGIPLEEKWTPAEKLKAVQARMNEGHPGARAIYETIGVYFGYAIAWYARFYRIRHVLIMGRVTSGEGGAILLERAGEVLRTEFPALAEEITLHIPDEKSRRVGQSVAAASLPEIGGAR